MDNIFRKFCHYYITDKDPKLLEELRELAQDEFDDYDIEVKEFINQLQKSLKRLGYSIDFESFCNLLEEYINKKESLNDEEKREYLKVLRNLSELYEVNLREELERYVSYKKEEPKEIDENDLFYKFCKYNISPNNNVDEFNELREIAENNNIPFKELQKKSIMFVEELKISAEHLGFDIEVDSIEYIVREYLRKKNKLTDFEKSRYLKILLYLSEVYDVNLRDMLETTKEEPKENNTIDINELLRNISNPLDNEEVLSVLLNQRYNNGYFEIRDITLKSDTNIEDKQNYDFDLYHAELTYKLYRIFIDKYNNYALEDLNEEYLNMLSEEDIITLDKITQDELYEIIKLIHNRESSQYIIKKYKLTNNVYLFIEKSINETTDIRLEHIGIRNQTLFNSDNSQYTIKLYLNGPEEETHKVLNKYIVDCVEENINYDMKATGDNRDSQERTILYANINDISKKISILDNIFNEDPLLKKSFSNPIHSSGRINDSVYGISHSGVITNDLTCINSYNDYFNNICEVSYYRVLAKIILDIVDDETAKIIIQNFISLQNVSFAKADMESPELAEYNNVSFETIKDLINQYIPLISSTLNIYMTDKEKNNAIVTEFKKSIMYISNICQGRDKRFPSNIVINTYLEQFIKNN
ncbi:MAG: hypothetical protein E7171_08270 [Firmicutes bacterium]|nr:hypothetical protein [Bacillota bacterium]